MAKSESDALGEQFGDTGNFVTRNELNDDLEELLAAVKDMLENRAAEVFGDVVASHLEILQKAVQAAFKDELEKLEAELKNLKDRLRHIIF